MGQLPSNYGPLYYASAVLKDGRVVVCGGEYNFGNGVWTDLGAWYDPATDAWTPLASPGWGILGDAQCAVMPDGKFITCNILNSQAALLDPATMTWQQLVGTGKIDRHDEEGYTMLRDGTLFTPCAEAAIDDGLQYAQKYDVALDKWFDAGIAPSMLVDNSSEEMGCAILTYDNTVLCIGSTGHNDVYHPGVGNNDPGTWTAAPDFPDLGDGQLQQSDGPGVILPNGKAMVYVAPGIFGRGAHFMEWDGTSFSEAPNLPNSPNNPAFVGNFLILPNGQVMFTDFSNDVEIYTPDGTHNPSWEPTITSSPATALQGATFTLHGTQLNGLTQGSFYGDDNANYTNYPIVRVRNVATGHVRYARTHDHSTMAIATGNADVTTQVTIPDDMEIGASMMSVCTNGIRGQEVPITIQQSGNVALQVSPNPVDASDTAIGTVTLLSNAPPGGATVTITSSDPRVTVPSSIVIPAGSKTGTFNAVTSTSLVGYFSNISVSYSATVKTVKLNVNPLTATPPADFSTFNAITAGNVGQLQQSDDNRFLWQIANGALPYGGIILHYQLANTSPTKLKFQYERQSAPSGVNTEVMLYNVRTRTYDVVGRAQAYSYDTSSVITIPHVGNYVNPATGDVYVQLRCSYLGFRGVQVWTMRADQAVLFD
jgi:hypothetical protein